MQRNEIMLIKSQVGVWGEHKTRVSVETALGAEKEPMNSAHMTPRLGIEPWPHSLVGGECSD